MTQVADNRPKMLFVDDRSKRIHSALRQYGGKYRVTIAPNVPETLRLLSSEDWDVISLDFDLDGNDLGDPNSKTCSMEIVHYIEECGWPEERKVPTWIIHSSNLFGANLLFHALRNIWRDNIFVKVLKQPFVYDEGAK